MNCSEVKNSLFNMLNDDLSTDVKKDIMLHISSCPECAQEFKDMSQVYAALKPEIIINSTNKLKTEIMNKINSSLEKEGIQENFNKRNFFIRISGIAAVLAITFALVFFLKPQFFNQANAAQSLLDKSIAALSKITTMQMHFQVRSLPGEDFDLLDLNSDFIEYKIFKKFSDPQKWRIEKPDLIAIMDGDKLYRVNSNQSIGYIAKTDAGLVSWMRIFLDPEKILENEKDFSAKNKAKYLINKTETETILTVKANALGNFKNPYLLNKSFRESKNRRVYHFDIATDKLNAVEIYVENKGKEILVLETSDIIYDQPVSDAVFDINLISPGINWIAQGSTDRLTNDNTLPITAEGVSELWWNSLVKEDWETACKLYLDIEKSNKFNQFKVAFGGLKVINLGKTFKSGQYSGVFIPYEVELKSGEKVTGNLALRNDNPSKRWVIDGGL